MGNSAGFTIIETLVALAILCLALITFYDVGRSSVRTMSHVERIEEAILLAQSKLDEMTVVRGLLAAQTSGRFDGTSYAWTISAIPLPDATHHINTVHLQNVTLTVTWREGLNELSVSVNTRHLGRGES